MLEYRIPNSACGLAYTEEEIALVAEVMRATDTQTQGRYLQEFEAAFASYNNTEHCFAVSSCTAALELAAVCCQLKPGDEVILPAHTFCATAIPFARSGASLVWADIDLESRVVTAETIAPLITPRTKVIVVVHLYGLIADMDAISGLAEAHRLLVVEDCAQALGASLHGVRCGNFGDFACFSFHTHKNISTLGEGGMLVVRNPDLAALVPGLRHNGIRSFPEGRPRYWIPAMTDVDFDLAEVWPYNFCIGEAQCALGAKLLQRVDQLNTKRNSRARKFMDALSDFPELRFQKVFPDRFNSYYCLAALYEGAPYNKTRDDAIDLLVTDYRIPMCVQYRPLYRYPMFRKAGFGNANCPHSDYFFDNMMSFPFNEWLPDEDLEYVIEATRRVMLVLCGS